MSHKSLILHLYTNQVNYRLGSKTNIMLGIFHIRIFSYFIFRFIFQFRFYSLFFNQRTHSRSRLPSFCTERFIFCTKCAEHVAFTAFTVCLHWKSSRRRKKMVDKKTLFCTGKCGTAVRNLGQLSTLHSKWLSKLYGKNHMGVHVLQVLGESLGWGEGSAATQGRRRGLNGPFLKLATEDSAQLLRINQVLITTTELGCL